MSDNLTTRLTDIQSKTILENMKPKLRNKDYDRAVLDAIKNITDANNGKTIKETKDETTGMAIIFVIVVLIGIVILLVIDVGGGFGGDSDGFWFSSDGSDSSFDGGFSGGGFSGGGHLAVGKKKGKNMNKKYSIIGGIIAVIALIGLFVVGSYNSLVSSQTTVEKAQSKIETTLRPHSKCRQQR